ncbi:MAG: rhamnogalacturonan acetylesterase [Prolixibacteraceae bacterium]|nr:rhamnogalacturonan acetylesterase [Prolixibacteraceae bacterium]
MNKKAIIIFLVLSFHFLWANAQCKYLFEFGKPKGEEGIYYVTQPVTFSSETGFGFDIENSDSVSIVTTDRVGYCTSTVPFYFSVKVPEGVYDVSVTVGNPEIESEATIKAEARRLMVFNQKIEAGSATNLHFSVSVRTPKIDSARNILLKSREENYMNWDNRITLEFSGKNVAVQAITIEPKKEYKTLFLAGNSTVTDQDCAPWASWGQMITRYFTPNIVVANYAESGESLSGFKSRGRLDKVFTQLKPGDYLFIEFGHNDQKQKGEGIGPWESFTDLLIEYITLTREKGGIPVLITPTQRRSFNDEGKIELTHGDYPAAMRKVAEEYKVTLIDLNEMTKSMYEAWGSEASKLAFVHYPENTFPGQETALEDNTHFNTFGANEVAQCVLKGICEKVPELKPYIVGFDERYSPASPSSFSDWDLVMSPRFVSKKPEGN